MKDATIQDLSVPSQNHPPKKDTKSVSGSSSSRCDMAPASNHKSCLPYITRAPGDIHPEDYLPAIKILSPSLYGLFSEVVTDHELWKTFRQMAAEAFCKGNRTYFLEYSPSSPFYFATLKAIIPYQGGHRRQNPSVFSQYSLEDLAKIAEQLVTKKRPGDDFWENQAVPSGFGCQCGI